MPIYEYQCEKCRHHLEALQKISDKPLRECPECGRHTLKRLISAPRFRLAGSGWYETDFKSEKEAKRNLAGRDEAPAEPTKETAKDAGGESGAKPEAKPESKPEPKPESKDGKSEAPASRKTIVTRPAAKPPVPRPKGKPSASKKAAKRTVRKR